MRRILLRILSTALALPVLAACALFALYYVPDPGDGAPQVLVAVDRTVWNRLGLNRLTYVRKLRLAGLSPVLVGYSRDGSASTELFDNIGGLVLTGGGDVAADEYGGDPSVTLGVKPARDAFELALLDEAQSRALPVLGLCRGAQLMNVHRGGTLGDFRDEPRFRVHRNALKGHPVTIDSDIKLAEIYGTSRLDEVTTWHGQHVDRPGRGVEVTAYALDGIPEALEVDGESFFIGVQWHAEMPPWDTQQDRLFVAFASAVREFR